MSSIRLRRFWYHVRHHWATRDNLIVAVAAVAAISWAWASVEVVQRNYKLQRAVDDKRRAQQLIELETATLAYEQRYYKSEEYQELETRKRLGLVDKGEKVLVLPANSPAVIAADEVRAGRADEQAAVQPPSNFEQWMNFLFGGTKRQL